MGLTQWKENSNLHLLQPPNTLNPFVSVQFVFLLKILQLHLKISYYLYLWCGACVSKDTNAVMYLRNNVVPSNMIICLLTFNWCGEDTKMHSNVSLTWRTKGSSVASDTQKLYFLITTITGSQFKTLSWVLELPLSKLAYSIFNFNVFCMLI